MSRRERQLAAAVLLVAVLVGGSPGRVVRGQDGAVGGATTIVSPTTVATWLTRREPPTLELLILWRGAPGWFTRGEGPQSSSGGGSGDLHWTVWRYRGLELRAEFNLARRTVKIQDRDVPLPKGANVIFVDQIDQPDKWTIAATAAIDAPIADPKRIDQILRISPDVVTYLRCDATMPDDKLRLVVERMCQAITAK